MQKENSTKTKYPLATAGKRIMAKVIDIVMIAIIVVLLGLTIFCTDSNFVWNQPLVLHDNWRYGLFATLVAILFFGLMFLLPLLWNKTIGMKAMKLFYFNKQGNKVWNMFKHELFVWEIVVCISFIMGWTLSGLSQLQIDSLFQGANAIWISSVPENIDKVCYYVGTGFSVFYGISILFLIAIIIAICIRNGRPAFHDKYSNLLIAYRKPYEGSSKQISHKKKDVEFVEKVPGQLSDDSLDELDRI